MRLGAVEREAAEWLGKRDRGFSPEEKVAFEGWVASDPVRGAAVREIERTWKYLDGLQAMPRAGDVNPDALAVKTPPLGYARGRQSNVFHLLGWGAVAAALVGAAVMWKNGRRADGLAPMAHFAADGGQYRHVALEDGSSLDLNRGGEVEVQYSAGARKVKLLRGEARFQVVANAARPFYVTAGSVRVRDVGTAFDVRLAADAVTVLVTEGTVQVVPIAVADRAESWPSSSQAVVAGERATLAPASSGAVAVLRVAPSEIAREIAWTARPLELEEMPLGELVAQFNRVNLHPVRIADPDLAAMKISGSFALDNEDAFVSLLGTAYGVQADRSGSGEIVLRRGR